MRRLVFLALVAALAAPATAATTRDPGFRTPSKNIACAAFSLDFTTPYLRCDILSGLKPQPTGKCDLDWTGFSMHRTGRATYVCAGDTVNGVNPTILPYGKTWRARGFTCTSKVTGVRCSNESRHGFFLSRERSYRF